MDRKAVILLNEVTNAKIEIRNDEEEIDMCKAIYDIRMEGVEEGLAAGREEGLKVMIHTLKHFINTPEGILEEVSRHKEYAYVTLEHVMKYY